MTPKISVIVPVYKVEEYLPRCIDSILSQSFTDFELILVDDGSPDNCGKICDEYAQKDSRVRVFHKPNGGVSSARNLGLDNAYGKWISFIDPDDYVDADYLYELFSTLEEYNTDFVATVEYKVQVECNTTYLSSEDFSLLFTDYKFDNGPGPVGKLFKADILAHNNVRFKLKVHSGEDSIFVYQYLLGIKDIVLIFSDKYHYDQTRPNSLSKSIPSYESTFIGKQEFDRTYVLMKTKMRLNNDSICNLNRTSIAFTDRVLKSIIRIPNRKDRVKKLSELDLSFYNKNKIPGTWKEAFLTFLLKKRLFYLYDILMSLRKKISKSSY